MPSVKDICWIAGILEGEGSFGAHGNTRKTRYPVIRLAMTDGDTVKKARLILGGDYHIKDSYVERRKIFYTTRIYGKAAIAWMMTIYPLMSERRKLKIKEIINEWKIIRKRKSRFHKMFLLKVTA